MKALSICVILLSFGGSTFAADGPVRINEFVFKDKAELVQKGRRCATEEPSALQRNRAAVARNLFRGRNPQALENAKVVVPVVFHVIHDGEKGKLDRHFLEDQIKVLNDCYSAHGFEFKLKDVTDTDNAQWFRMAWHSKEEYEAKNALSTKHPTEELNFYTANLEGGLLGWATFPSDLASGDPSTPYMDGVVVNYTSLPHVPPDADDFNLGMTAVHECGHWLGLYHTFQGGCVEPGDEVNDTPAEATPAFGCPEKEDPNRDTCDAAGKDPTRNFMDYANDACMHEFTDGQVTRMKEQVGAFRPKLLQSSGDGARIEPQKFDAKTLDAVQ